MSRVLCVSENSHLVNRLRQSRDAAAIELEVAGWSDWQARVTTRHRPSVALLDLAAPGAPELEALAASPALSADLRFVLLVGERLAGSPTLRRVLQSPRVDFVRAPVDTEEVWLRVSRLLAADRPSREAVGSGSRSSHGSAFPLLVTAIHHPESGRLDAKRISLLFGLPLAEVARIVGRSPAAVHKTPDAPSLQAGLALFERIAAPLLFLAGSEEHFRSWLNAANEELEGATPLSLLREGEAAVVAELLEDVLRGQPS